MSLVVFPSEMAAALVHFLDDTHKWRLVQVSFAISVFNLFVFVAVICGKAHSYGGGLNKVKAEGLIWTSLYGKVCRCFDRLCGSMGEDHSHFLCFSLSNGQRVYSSPWIQYHLYSDVVVSVCYIL